MADSADIALIKKAFKAFGAGDVATLRQVIAPDCVRRAPGNSPGSGDIKGRDAILERFAQIAKETDGTLAVTPEVLFEDGQGHVVALSRIRGKRAGKSLDTINAETFTIVNGKVEDALICYGDLAVENAFWGGTTLPARDDLAVVGRGYDAFGAGDMDTLREVFAPDVTQYVGGASMFTGVYRGVDEVLAFYGRLAEETDNTFEARLESVTEDGRGHVVAIHRETAQRKGRKLDQRHALLFQLLNGKITELHDHAEDIAADDAFYA